MTNNTFIEKMAEFLAKAADDAANKPAGRAIVDPEGKDLSMHHFELLSPRGKRSIELGLALGALSALGSGVGSLAFGNKLEDALEHSALGGLFGGASGYGLNMTASKLPSFLRSSLKTPIPFFSKIWSDPYLSTYLDPETGTLVDAPSVTSEYYAGRPKK